MGMVRFRTREAFSAPKAGACGMAVPVPVPTERDEEGDDQNTEDTQE